MESQVDVAARFVSLQARFVSLQHFVSLQAMAHGSKNLESNGNPKAELD